MKSLIFASLMLPVWAFAALVDPRLQGFVNNGSGTVQVLALMDMNVSRPLPVRATPAMVRAYLNDETRIAFTRVQQNLSSALSNGSVQVVTLHFINMSFTAKVTPEGLRALARTPGVSKVYGEAKITGVKPVAARPASPFRESIPYDLAAMKLDELWKSNPNINGSGVLVGHLDTGIDGKHPALAGKVAVFFDASKGRTSEPFDNDTHGTHTAGTVVGSGPGGAPMGVAPGARLVGAAALTGYDEMLKSMAFMMNPDGKKESNVMPRLVTNSWNCEGAPDLEAFYRAISAWEAAGILTVFSAGNSGPSPRSITKPHEHPLAFAVAATGPGGKIANFSSRGPGIYNGKETQKPDVSAPGVDIVSAVPGGKFEAMSGTSMAAPHVAGLAALLYQVEPNLTPAKAREVMLRSLDFVDAQGQTQSEPKWNAVFGFGHVNALKAINVLKTLTGRSERRWGTFMAPAVDLVNGFGNLTNLTTTFGGSDDVKNVFQVYATDEHNWIQGEQL